MRPPLFLFCSCKFISLTVVCKDRGQRKLCVRSPSNNNNRRVNRECMCALKCRIFLPVFSSPVSRPASYFYCLRPAFYFRLFYLHQSAQCLHKMICQRIFFFPMPSGNSIRRAFRSDILCLRFLFSHSLFPVWVSSLPLRSVWCREYLNCSRRISY